MLFPSKLNTQEFLFCAMKTHGSVLEYAMLAINISLLQHSHLKPDTLDRKGRILWARSRLYSPVSSKAARSRHYYLAKSARLRHYHLASDHKWNERSTDISLLIQGSYRSWKTWKVMEFDNLDSRPGKSWNFGPGPGKSWNFMLANVYAAELPTVLDCLTCTRGKH